METAKIEMDPSEAEQKMLACLHESHRDGEEFNQACLVAYEELAAGRKLIHLSKSFQRAGLDENHRPRIAIGTCGPKRGVHAMAQFESNRKIQRLG